MYLTMYLFKKLYFMVLSDRRRDTERPISSLLGVQWVEWTCNTVPTKNKIQKGQFLLPFFFAIRLFFETFNKPQQNIVQRYWQQKKKH